MYSLKEYLSEALVKHKISNYRNEDDVVDFGLSVKWLKYNLAGDKLTDDESDYGYYYQWGSTIGYPDATKHKFTWQTTPYCSGSSTSLAKYVTKPSYGTVDNKTILEPMDDAVTTLLGSEYRMPTVDEYVELYKHCTGSSDRKSIVTGSLSGTTSVSSKGTYWVNNGTTVDGVKYVNAGCLFVGQDITKRIFFPASGHCNYSSVYHVDSCGCYWASSLNSSYSIDGYILYFKSSYVYPSYYDYRHNGFSIRGVKVK